MVLIRSLSSLPCRVDDAESIMNLASTCKDMFALCKEPGVARNIWRVAAQSCVRIINKAVQKNAKMVTDTRGRCIFDLDEIYVLHIEVHGMHLIMLPDKLDELVCLTEDVVEIVAKTKELFTYVSESMSYGVAVPRVPMHRRQS